MDTKDTCNMAPNAGSQSSVMGASCGQTIGLQKSQSAHNPSVRVSLDVEARSNFSEALRHVVNGGKASRVGWNGAGQHVFAKYPDACSMMSAPYLVLRNTQGALVPWAPSQGDVFANDWALLPGRMHDAS